MAACRTRQGKNCAAVHTLKRSYVVCAGLIYGMGEEYEACFAETFMSAWNNTGEPMSVLGKGNNLVPTIHVKDLSRVVQKVIEFRPDPTDHPYIFAVDNATGQTQLNIIKSVARKFGIEKLERRLDPPKESVENLGVNLRMRPSSVVTEEMGESEWHCRTGLAANVDRMFEEFRAAKGLRSLRVLLIGPPLSGKSHFAEW